MAKLCFSTLGCTRRTLDEILSLAKHFGISLLEIRGIDGEMDNRNITAWLEENQTKTVDAFTAAQVSPYVLGTSCMFHDPIKFAASIEEGKASIEIASRFGIPYIRVFGNRIIGQNKSECMECISRVISGIRELCRYAIDKNVMVLLEVHGDYNRIETVHPIVEALKGESHFGLIWDIAHTRAYGESWPEFYHFFRSYIYHVHIKDCRLSDGCLTLPGEGNLPIVDIVQTMVDDGYDGGFSLEWEQKWHPELPDIEEALLRFVAIVSSAVN